MKVPSEYMGLILQEMDFAIAKMREAKGTEGMLYYFSACHGSINRVMNFFCDPMLVFVHQVLATVHGALTGRIAATKGQVETPVVVSEEMLEKLGEYLQQLRSALQEQQEPRIYEVLMRLSNLAYATTGNGFYLYLRGMLKL